MVEIAPRGELPIEFYDHVQLDAWLKDQPREVGLLMGGRAALRALPVMASDIINSKNEEDFSEAVLKVFRALATAWCMGAYSHHKGFRFAAASAGAASAAEAVRDVSATAAASSAGYAVAVRPGDAVRAAAFAIHDNTPTFWAQLSNDARRMARGDAISVIAGSPLWDEGAPLQTLEPWRQLADYLMSADGSWNVWIDWYNDRLVGRARGEDQEMIFAMVPPEKWDEGPTAVNTWITEHLSKPPGLPGAEAQIPIVDQWRPQTPGFVYQPPTPPFSAAVQATMRPVEPPAIETHGATIGPMSLRQPHVLTPNGIFTGAAPTAGTAPTPAASDFMAGGGPKLPEPGPGPRLIVRDEQLDIELHRSSDQPSPSTRSTALLRELREAARDFANSFDSGTNAHKHLRNLLDRYRAQIDLDDPDINLIFALGLRLENAEQAARRAIADRIEAALEDSQTEALSSVLRIHAVFIVSEPEGTELLEAAERYAYTHEDDERFKGRAERVAQEIAGSKNLATGRLNEFLEGSLAEMNCGEHPARTGIIGRNTIQRALVFLGKAAIGGVAAYAAQQIFGQSNVGHAVIADGVLFANKAVEFFLTHTDDLRALAAVANDGFGFLTPLTDWIRSKFDE
jgi:hypothetical protein